MTDPLQYEWLIPGRLMRFPGTTDRDLISARKQVILDAIEAEGKPPLVHCLIDHTNRYTEDELAQQPRKARDYVINEEARKKLHSHKMLGWTISIATPNLGLKMAGNVTSQQDNYRWRSVETIQDAFDWLQQVDTTLPDLSELDVD